MYNYDSTLELITDNLAKSNITGRCNFLANQNKSYIIFFHNKILISMARLAGKIHNIDIPFISNYKIFLDDNAQYDNITLLPSEIILKYIAICCSHLPFSLVSFKNIENFTDFFMILTKYNITIDTYIYQNIQIIKNIEYCVSVESSCNSDEYKKYIESIYALYGIIVSEYLNAKKYDLTGECPFTTIINDDLNKINIYTPLEEQITLHYFCIAYLRTKKQRNQDYPAIFASATDSASDSDTASDSNSNTKEKTYTYKEITDALFIDANPVKDKSDNSANNLSNNIKKILTEMYRTVNLNFNPLKNNGTVYLSHYDFSITVLWYMLFRHQKLTDEYICKFDPIIKNNVNIRKFFTTLNLESLNDYDTLCTDRKETNVGAIVNTFLMNAVSKDYEEIDCTTPWNSIKNTVLNPKQSNYYYLILYNFNIQMYSYLFEQLKNEHSQIFDLYHPTNILDEYKYLARFYNFVVGIDTMKTIFTTIYNNFDKFKNVTLPIPNVNKPTIDDFFQKEFIENELYVVSPSEGKTTQIQSIKDKMPTTQKAYRIIYQQQKYSARNISAFIWLHHNGKEFRIDYPNGYNAPIKQTDLAAIIKNEKINSRFHQAVIINFVTLLTRSTDNFEETKKYCEKLLSLHTQLMDFINYLDNPPNNEKYTPYQKMKILHECLSNIAVYYYS